MKNTVYILPYQEWKAFRFISFMIEGVQATLIYQRKFGQSQLRLESSEVSHPIDRSNCSLNLPIDEIDELLLSWFKVIDSKAEMTSKLFIISSEVSNLQNYYSGLPNYSIEMFAFPSFGNYTIDQMKKLDGTTLVQFNRIFQIVAFGSIPKGKILSATGYYDYSAESNIKSLMNKLETEVCQLNF